MTRSRYRQTLALLSVLGLAFVLRIYKLDAVPLRGDEAFAVRYWADSPREVIRTLAEKEPHPLGTFLSFWAWKQLVGESVFAMRYLPLLGNLLGVAAVMALGKRLLHDSRAAWLAALLWAVNPFLIWHSQDVRNYAIWAGMSPLAMWLFLRAADTNRPRAWIWYVVVETAALYMFFLESFLLVVQAAYLLLFRRSQRVMSRAAAAWAILGVILIPWLVQLWYLSNSGYTGTLGHGSATRLFTWFLPDLLAGDSSSVVIPALWCSGLIFLAVRKPSHRWLTVWLAEWISIPSTLLLIAATRMSVFHPRYVIAVLPALLLLIADVVRGSHNTPRLSMIRFVVLLVPLAGLSTLVNYYQGEAPKSPNWPVLARYFEDRAGPHEFIFRLEPDPAFTYYYRGPAGEDGYRPDVSIGAQLASELNFYDTIWLVGRSPEVEAYLGEHMQALGTHIPGGFPVTEYRHWTVSLDEMAVSTDVVFGEVARLVGYTIQGPDSASQAITVLLYWEPLKQTEVDYKVFVHLLGPPHPDGSPVWGQDDHPPLYGFASTREWEPGSLLRDPYNPLAETPELAPGHYTLEVGLYDPANPNTRLLVNGADSYSLGVFDWPQ